MNMLKTFYTKSEKKSIELLPEEDITRRAIWSMGIKEIQINNQLLELTKKLNEVINYINKNGV